MSRSIVENALSCCLSFFFIHVNQQDEYQWSIILVFLFIYRYFAFLLYCTKIRKRKNIPQRSLCVCFISKKNFNLYLCRFDLSFFFLLFAIYMYACFFFLNSTNIFLVSSKSINKRNGMRK